MGDKKGTKFPLNIANIAKFNLEQGLHIGTDRQRKKPCKLSVYKALLFIRKAGLEPARYLYPRILRPVQNTPQTLQTKALRFSGDKKGDKKITIMP